MRRCRGWDGDKAAICRSTCVGPEAMPARLKDSAAELLRVAPDVIVTHRTSATAAMEQATRSIPIIFVTVNDPVEQGLIASLAHPAPTSPDSFVDFPLFGKSLDLLRQIAPKVTRVGIMFRPLTIRTTTTT